MPELTNEELLKALNNAKSTGIFRNSQSHLVDISDSQFCLISKELEGVKLTKISLLVGKINDASLKTLNEIFQVHPEIEKVKLECYSATPQQMAKIAAILPANSKEVDVVFSGLNEDILLKMLPPIGKLVKITNLFMASYADQFGSQIFEHEAKFLGFFYTCKNLQKFIIDNRSEDKHAKKLKDFCDQANAFLQYRENFAAFRANREQQENFDSVIAHFDTQLSLVAKLATRTFHFVRDDYFDFLIKYLSHAHYSYKQIPKVINCFVPFFQEILKHNLYYYLKFCLSFSDCVRQASVEDNIEEKDKQKILYEKKIFAATFLLEYELRTQLAKKENLVITVDAQYQTILVNLLNNLINQGLKVNQTLKDFFTQHPEEFCDILADVAKCMNKYKLPTDESLYEGIDEENCQSLLSGLLSKNGREQLIERKRDKITQYLQTKNSILSTQNDILQIKNELLTNRLLGLEDQLSKLQNEQLSKKHRNTASPQFFSQESPDDHAQKFTSFSSLP